MHKVITFVQQNDYIIGILGLVISGTGVFYGKKAYQTALDIFKKGLQIDEKKIFSQIGLEIAWGFAIPFSKFKVATKTIWENDYNKQSVIFVREILSNNKFSATFPYLEAHKGELWDALVKESMDSKSVDSFLAIMEFSESVKRLNEGIRELETCLVEYLNRKSGTLNYASLTLADFFREDPYVNDEMFKKGLYSVNMVEENLNNLPEELGIKEKFERLHKS